MTWMTSTWTTLHGEYSWMSHSKLQFILVETIWRTYDLSRTNSWSLWNGHSKWLKGWLRIRQTSVVWPQLTTNSRRGDRRPHYVTKAIEITSAKTYVFSDSVLCLGGISDQPVEAWKNQIKWYLETGYLKDLDRIDGEPIEFEWKNFQGSTKLGILEEIQKMMTELQCDHEQFKGRIIFMSMYNDIVWWERGNTEKCNYEFCYSSELCSQIFAGTLVIFGTWIREEMVRNLSWYTRWRLGQNCWKNDAQLCRKRSPYISRHQRPGKSRIKKQRKG